ncbi:MAG TPA: AMP-binding protein [Micromonosporaceae bacterium]|nr:AMP-binding protein [Micromonosporaceae bacterium]
MDPVFVLATLGRAGMLQPGSPLRVARQVDALRRWGFGLAGELRSAAARSPDRVAVIDERGELTYAALLDRAERLARALRRDLRLAAGDRLGILCRNGAGLVEGAVAAGLLGADAVLLNTGLSAPQLAAVAQEQQVRAVLHDSDRTGVPDAVPHLDEARVERMVATAPAGALRPPGREGRTIVLTSGTTGVPKGARRPTPPGLRPLASVISRVPLRVGERMMVAAPLFHTWGYGALQIALALRATMVLRRRFDPADTLRAVTEQGCAALFVVPVMVQRILELPAVPTPLRIVAASGSALPGGLAHRFMDAYGDILYNLYGTTEASWASIATPAELREAPDTAGRPPRGTRVAVLDAAGAPLPPGRVGRVFVGNEMLFDGYTSGAGKESRHGLLATGDLGHLDAGGLLYIAGREDDMIVSGGENVFPAEVENLLADLPQVREVAVVGVPDPEYGQRLAAYLVLHDGAALDAGAVREHVRAHRARFCVPRDVVFLDALPRNATGKVVPRDLLSPQ